MIYLSAGISAFLIHNIIIKLNAMGQTKQTFYETYTRTALRERSIPFIISAPITKKDTSNDRKMEAFKRLESARRKATESLDYEKERKEAASQEEILDAIEKDSFPDFEDCLQDKCAKEIGADYIITCNTKDFENSEIPAVNPQEFFQRF